MKQKVLLLTLTLNVILLILVGAFAVNSYLLQNQNTCLAEAEVNARFQANEVNDYVLNECLKAQFGYSFCKNIAEERGLDTYNEILESNRGECD
jgi:hypothetical protein